MSSLFTVTRQAETIQAYQLTSADDMHTALKYIQPGGYSGAVQVDATGTWSMYFQSTSAANTQLYSAKINDYVIIENNSLASVCPASKFGNLYTAS